MNPHDTHPPEGDDVGVPEWTDDVHGEFVRINQHDHDEYTHTFWRFGISDDSDNQTLIVSDTIVNLDKIR